MAPPIVPDDEPGFARLVAAHQAMVYGIAWHSMRNPADAEDLAQEVFLALYQHRAAIHSAEHLRFWLRQVTARRCVSFRRRWRPFAALDENAPAAPTGTSDPWQASRLRRLVRSLAAPARLVLVLRYQEDREPEEIAELLNMPVATVKSHLRRSLQRLRRHWPDADKEEKHA